MSRLLLITALLLAPEASARGLMIIGDSISARENSWANQLQSEAGWPNIQRNAQPGRQIVGFTLSDDLMATHVSTACVYYLGTNDGYHGIPIDQVRKAFVGHMRALLKARYHILVLIPPSTVRNGEPIRQMMDNVTRFLEIETIDMDQIWVPELVPDGIHPNAEMGGIIKQAVVHKLVDMGV